MNWNGWWQWAVQHQHRELGLLFILIGVSTPLIATLTAVQLFRTFRNKHNPMAKRLALFFAGVAVMGWFGLTANVDPPTCQCAAKNITYSLWFAWWYWIGNGALLIAVSAMGWFALHPHNGSATHKQD